MQTFFDWPATMTEYAAFFANVATAIGIGSIAFTFRAHVNVGARLALLREIQAYSLSPDGVPLSGDMSNVFNVVLHWACNHAFSKGPGTPEFEKLDEAGKSQYRTWLAHVVALFDLVFLDKSAGANPVHQNEMRAFLLRHAAELSQPFPIHFRTIRAVSFSKPMRAVLREVVVAARAA